MAPIKPTRAIVAETFEPESLSQRVHCWLACGCGGIYDVDEETVSDATRHSHYHRCSQRVVSTMPISDPS